jgi:hypothetical protein
MTAALIVALAGTACDLMGARDRPLRTSIVHLAVAASMIAMVIPTRVGTQVVAAALLVAFIWTAVASIRTSGRDAPERLHDARQLAELAGSAVLLVIMSALHGPSATPAVSSAHGHMHAAPAFAAPLTAGILIGWGATVALAAVATARRREAMSHESRANALGGTLMLLGMVAMASTALAGR